MNDRDKLQRLLETRASADFQSMTDAQLIAFVNDVGRQLASITRPASAYDHHNPEDRARVATAQELFRRLIGANKERNRRIHAL